MKYKCDESRETSHRILAYLLDNPEAQYTMEGIVDWWLLQQDIKRNVARIRKRVDGCFKKEFCRNDRSMIGRNNIKLNDERLPEILALIEKE